MDYIEFSRSPASALPHARFSHPPTYSLVIGGLWLPLGWPGPAFPLCSGSASGPLLRADLALPLFSAASVSRALSATGNISYAPREIAQPRPLGVEEVISSAIEWFHRAKAQNHGITLLLGLRYIFGHLFHPQPPLIPSVYPKKWSCALGKPFLHFIYAR
jgi:hypothetical protein